MSMCIITSFLAVVIQSSAPANGSYGSALPLTLRPSIIIVLLTSQLSPIMNNVKSSVVI